MDLKAERFDCGTVLVDMCNDVNVVAGALRRQRHRHPMRHEVPILGHEIDQHWLQSRGIQP